MRAPRGLALHCKSWRQEAALRLLLNSHDPDLAGSPDLYPDANSLATAFEVIADDQSVFVNPGHPPLVLQSDSRSPSAVLVSVRRGDDSPTDIGPFLLEGMRGSWTSSGRQGPTCAAYEVFSAAAKDLWGADLPGKFLVSGGMGRRGGSISLAAMMHGAAFLGIDPNESAILAHIRSGSCDICVNDLDEALRILKAALRQKQAVSVGLVGNCALVLPEMARRGILPDLLTDCTGSRRSYVPEGIDLCGIERLRSVDEASFGRRVVESRTRHMEALLELQRLGAVLFEIDKGVISELRRAGFAQALGIPDWAAKYLAPRFRAGDAPMTFFALSGERGDISRLDEVLTDLSPTDAALSQWLRVARKHVRYQGIPARVAWARPDSRQQWVQLLNDLVRQGAVKAPIVVCREFPPGSPSPPAQALKSEGFPGMASIRQLLGHARLYAPGSAITQMELEREQIRLRSIAVVVDGSPEALQGLRLLGESYTVS